MESCIKFSEEALGEIEIQCLPDALEMHRTNLHNMAGLFRFQDAIPASSGHSSDV
jgi:hypothetical protein